ncbi:hypothetical protein J1N35_025465 [Gossypium stocksii]|uniref:RNase H type-1 domain-containing protein n=1 Tax=Gossypium stocksii TaxID=47602 RepID=A0A9D3V6D9_9ROSI|nr:hypothetical protein J1N35_025465 [Gossypium stocksii]
MMGSATCRRCQNGVETRKHLFRECPIANETWEKLNIIWSIIDANTNFKEWIKNILASNSMAKCRMIACAMWVIWTSRNRSIHEGKGTTHVLAEAMVCLQVLNLVLHLGLRDVEIEGDSRSVIRKLPKQKERQI